jgi:3-deoxy-D-manno-octulosonic acid kinase
MTNRGRRIATATGAMLADPDSLGNPPPEITESLFDPEFWRARGELAAVSGGRGSAWFIAAATHNWALRHCRRGGFIARFSQDRYVWAGEDRVRSFAEWRMLRRMADQGLPVPKPIAARYQRSGLFYRCDLITQRIVGAQPLSAVLAARALPETAWRAVGAAIARLHEAGVDHADLNAHNILIGGTDEAGSADDTGGVSVIDFDRGRMRLPGHWALENLQRLRRSLEKISRQLPADRWPAPAWGWLMSGYGAVRGRETARGRGVA